MASAFFSGYFQIWCRGCELAMGGCREHAGSIDITRTGLGVEQVSMIRTVRMSVGTRYAMLSTAGVGKALGEEKRLF
jgi:hypothetical protein